MAVLKNESAHVEEVKTESLAIAQKYDALQVCYQSYCYHRYCERL
jgi:hypothetical protein